MIQKLRRQSVRASSITKGKLGLGSNRAQSFVTPAQIDYSHTPFDQLVDFLNIFPAAFVVSFTPHVSMLL